MHNIGERERDITTKSYLLGPLRQVLVDTVVASVELAAREPRHIPGLEAALGHAVEVSEPLQGRPGGVSPELVGLVEALLVHRLFFLCLRHLGRCVLHPAESLGRVWGEGNEMLVPIQSDLSLVPSSAVFATAAGSCGLM